MYYEVTIEMGHPRNSEPFQIVQYVEAESTVLLFEELEKRPGLSSEDLGYAITMVKPISEDEFLNGKEKEKSDPNALRMHIRFNVTENCTISPADSESGFEEPIEAKTSECSVGGLGVVYNGPHLKEGARVRLAIPKLKIRAKEAEVMWVEKNKEKVYAGLRWL